MTSKFNFGDQASKDALKERALKLKPKEFGVVAHESGWVKVQPNGYIEQLVSFRGLDALLGDNEEPIVEAAEPVVVVAPVVVEAPVEKKKGGRPAKATPVAVETV